MKQHARARTSAIMIALLLLQSCFYTSLAQASMIATETVVMEQRAEANRAELLDKLQSDEIRAQLEAMGVSPAQAEERINALTPTELAELNEQLTEAPAGEGVLGVLATIFIVLIVTDLLCATDVFSFVSCINK